MKHEIAADHVLHSRGREAILHRYVEVTGKDTLEKLLGLEVRNEVASDRIFKLALVVTARIRNCSGTELSILAAIPKLL